MPKKLKKPETTANLGFEAKLWAAADALRNHRGWLRMSPDVPLLSDAEAAFASLTVFYQSVKWP